MIILIIGSGGRENIIIEKLNNGLNELHCIGTWKNPDIIKNIKQFYLVDSLCDYKTLYLHCSTINPELIVIGPEPVLITDFVDLCNKVRCKCIGPSKLLSQLETSKYFTRELLTEINESSYNPSYFLLDKSVSTEYLHDYLLKNYHQIVIKIDSLAKGKGVFVQGDHFNSIDDGIILLNTELVNEKIVIEEKLMGEEFSVFTFSDGNNYFHFPPVQDYKRAFENHEGPNTGGMGSIKCNFSFLSEDDVNKCEYLNSKVLNSLKRKYNMKYVGILYGSFIKTIEGDIKLIEFNCRFGDSEVFNILNGIETDLTEIFKSMIEGNLNTVDIKLKDKVNIVKYLVPEGYPTKSKLKTISYKKIPHVYSASIDENYNLLGSRSIAIYAEGDNLNEAYEKCEEMIKIVNRDNLYWRSDIGNIREIISPLPPDSANRYRGMEESRPKYSYKDSGVDIDKGNAFVKLIKNDVESTYNSNVIGEHGNFGGQYNFKNNVLVASTDGVGTKGILIKKYTDNYYTCGHDIVNHCINDILVQGAKPLFFLDYVASSKLNIKDTASFVKGCCDACKKVDCVLLGGETAEMPSVYKDGHMDMVGTIIGEKIIEIEKVEENDLFIGLSSSGPQTNGYSLIRKLLENNIPPKEVLESLLTKHGSFLDTILHINRFYKIGGMCHITGGGLTENLKRTIPSGLTIDLDSIIYPKWCNWIMNIGHITENEMKHVFNCGIGFITFIKPIKRESVLKIGILGSTKGTVMGYLMKSIQDKMSLIYKKVEIVKVITNKKTGGILEKSESLGLKNVYLPKVKGMLDDIYYSKIDEEFSQVGVELILCIGWMKKIPIHFLNKWENRCINVHPSLLPKYTGGMDLDVHKNVISNKDKESGCTVHIVTEHYDEGPIITQKKCQVSNGDTPESLKNKVQHLEGQCLTETLYFFYNNLIDFILKGNKVGIVKKISIFRQK